MDVWVQNHAALLRLGSVLVVFALFGVLERLRPRRRCVGRRGQRWATNFGLLALSMGVARLVVPAGAVGAALFAAERDFGWLTGSDLPDPLIWIIAIVLLDLAVWVQHVAMHRVPMLWRMHRVHHADQDLDTSSGVRFHPLEILVSLGWKAMVIVALGVPAGAVIVFEALLATFAVATHANIGLPASVERAMRTAFITPDLHRIHHSLVQEESNTNFGTTTNLWDRLFRTLLGAAQGSQIELPLGVEGPEGRNARWLWGALGSPFRRHRFDGAAQEKEC